MLDGVFCYNDPLAIGAMNTILEAGLRIPEDIAVIGCGNLHYDGSLRVPLSTRRSTQPEDRGARGKYPAEIDRIEGPPWQYEHHP